MLEIMMAQVFSLGGPILVLLIAMSLLGLTAAVYKALQFARLGVGRHGGSRRALAAWASGDARGALEIAGADRAAISRVVAAGMTALLSNPQDAAHAEQIAAQEAQRFLATLSRHLRAIESIVQAAPMLGLLGTVIGMIDAFANVAAGGGAADPSALAGGIWVALTTTALGLMVAIPFYFISVWLEGRLDAERIALELAISEVTLARVRPA